MADQPIYLPTDERREATRFDKEPGTEYVIVTGPAGDEMTGEVQNESLGGMAVLLLDGTGLSVGSELRVSYSGDSLRAVVRHLEPLDDGRIRVGIDCRPAPDRG